MASDIDMLTFTLLIQLGMAIAIAQHKKFYIVKSPHIYHSYGDLIHIDTGPQTYEWVPISTIDMGMGVPISM